MIPQSNISKLSNRLYQELGGRRIPEAVLERDYCIAWFLVGLADTPLSSKLAFKGGTALKRCYFECYRFSEDLDFTLLEPFSFSDLKNELESVYQEVQGASGINFHFSREDSKSHQNSYTFYLAYEGPLPATNKEIKVDVTLEEYLTHPIEQRQVLQSYPEYSDLAKTAKISTYSLQEIATEKIVALLDRARTEPRDLYDLWQLMVETEQVQMLELEHAIEQKLAFRKKTLEEVQGEFSRKEARLKKTWTTRLATQMNHLPEFEGVYRSIKRELRQAGITAKV